MAAVGAFTTHGTAAGKVCQEAGDTGIQAVTAAAEAKEKEVAGTGVRGRVSIADGEVASGTRSVAMGVEEQTSGLGGEPLEMEEELDEGVWEEATEAEGDDEVEWDEAVVCGGEMDVELESASDAEMSAVSEDTGGPGATAAQTLAAHAPTRRARTVAALRVRAAEHTEQKARAAKRERHEAERRAACEARRVEGEARKAVRVKAQREKAELRAFEAELRLGAKLEEAQRRGGYVAVPHTAEPLKLSIRSFGAPVELRTALSAPAARLEGDGAAWVCCDLCDKWRLLPSGGRVPGEDEAWHCLLNPDATHAFCAAPEDPRARWEEEQTRIKIKLHGEPGGSVPHIMKSRQTMAPNNELLLKAVRISMRSGRGRKMSKTVTLA